MTHAPIDLCSDTSGFSCAVRDPHSEPWAPGTCKSLCVVVLTPHNQAFVLIAHYAVHDINPQLQFARTHGASRKRPTAKRQNLAIRATSSPAIILTDPVRSPAPPFPYILKGNEKSESCCMP